MIYEDAIKRVKRIKIDRYMLCVIAIDDLIKMKRKAGRDKDNLDIKTLNRIKKIRNAK